MKNEMIGPMGLCGCAIITFRHPKGPYGESYYPLLSVPMEGKEKASVLVFSKGHVS